MPSYHPPAAFSFKVDFLDVPGAGGDTEQRFQEVSGLSVEITTDELNEGGENGFTYKLPKRAKYPNLVLKRGMLPNSALRQWLQDAMSTYFIALDFSFKPSDILITLQNESGDPLAVWKVMQAYPVKWNTSDFKAADNALVVETIELAYQFFERQQ
ncbi:phage tail protein [Spirosoma radiotolerans]|uniref:Glycerol acyltransferase n=1 Tax=Spirosoma radiotolerans TaxID=1379870 RepID=A0A0E3ZW96_9BACT|nr:phage tail protein [Spirosoma radiotolerans]AKD55545.1 hypothetical protein SD10_12200 [Spirosoma radiotolerans]